MPAPNVRLIDNRETGHWKIFAYPYSQRSDSIVPVNITTVRGIPTSIGSLTFTEPFGPAEASMSFPSISPLEPVGMGSQDLWWLQPDMNIDIMWTATDTQTKELLTWLGLPTSMIWEGFVTSFDWKSGQGESVSISCTGAMRMLDNRVSQQVVANRPWPFEKAIENAFTDADNRHPTRLQPLRIVLANNSPIYEPKTRTTKRGEVRFVDPLYLRPVHVSPGQSWTGMLTRELGTWGKVLSDYVYTLLKVMYTENGQYTIQLDPGRQPVLRNRVHAINDITNPGSAIILGNQQPGEVNVDERKQLILDLTLPGVSVSATSDYGQTITTIYGTVNTTYSGTSYDGKVFDYNGRYSYEPFAKTPMVDKDQSVFKYHQVRREIYDTFPDGLTVTEAQKAARKHLSINGSPGIIGNVTLDGVDPTVLNQSGERVTFPRQMIKADMVIRLDGLHGETPGPLVYINEVTHNVDGDQVSFQVDSKFRDYAVTEEVKYRGRDALLPNHTINTKGDYSLQIQDSIEPWSYEKGCGYFPLMSQFMWKNYSANRNGDEPDFYEGWEEMTTAFPPKTYGFYYSKIERSKKGRGTAKDPVKADRFWNVPNSKEYEWNGRVRLAQAGSIMMSRFICVNKHGRIIPASFHVSVWQAQNASAEWTPQIPSNHKVRPGKDILTKLHGEWMYHPEGSHRFYQKSSRYPFYKNAWFDKLEDGLVAGTTELMPLDTAGNLYQGWGNYYEKAGYWPDSSRTPGAEPTGVFQDATEFAFDQGSQQGFNNTVELYKDNPIEKMYATILIFCDDFPDEDIYFIGRLYKKPEGGGQG